MFLFKPLVHKKNLPFVNILPNAYDRVKKARYGNYIPGNAYHLSSDGSKVPLNSYYRITAGLSIADHINLDKVVDILTKGVWAETPKFLNFKKNSNEEETLKEEKNSVNLISEDEVTINSARSFCINVNDEYYDLEYEDNETTLYVRKDNSTYVTKRVLDNKREYEYVKCSEDIFYLIQCDLQCICHEIKKNSRPTTIEQCSDYNDDDNSMNCLIDGISKQIRLKSFFGLTVETKIDDYYLMDYFCMNETYRRGNYQENKDK